MNTILLTKISIGEMVLDFLAFIIIAFLFGIIISILDAKSEKKDNSIPNPRPQAMERGKSNEKELAVTKDPLRILREDTYSNEEMNEITERMISTQNNTHHDNLPE